MKMLLASLLLTSSIAFGQTTRPTTQPTTQPAVDLKVFNAAMKELREARETLKEYRVEIAALKQVVESMRSLIGPNDDGWKLCIGATRDGLLKRKKELQLRKTYDSRSTEMYASIYFMSCTVDKITNQITSISW